MLRRISVGRDDSVGERLCCPWWLLGEGGSGALWGEGGAPSVICAGMEFTPLYRLFIPFRP